jgi:hypothetical protein
MSEPDDRAVDYDSSASYYTESDPDPDPDPDPDTDSSSDSYYRNRDNARLQQIMNGLVGAMDALEGALPPSPPVSPPPSPPTTATADTTHCTAINPVWGVKVYLIFTRTVLVPDVIRLIIHHVKTTKITDENKTLHHLECGHYGDMFDSKSAHYIDAPPKCCDIGSALVRGWAMANDLTWRDVNEFPYVNIRGTGVVVTGVNRGYMCCPVCHFLECDPRGPTCAGDLTLTLSNVFHEMCTRGPACPRRASHDRPPHAGGLRGGMASLEDKGGMRLVCPLSANLEDPVVASHNAQGWELLSGLPSRGYEERVYRIFRGQFDTPVMSHREACERAMKEVADANAYVRYQKTAWEAEAQAQARARGVVLD